MVKIVRGLRVVNMFSEVEIVIGNVNNISNLSGPFHYCGRANKHHGYKESALHNPFKLYSEAQRKEVCERYRVYFYKQIENNNSIFINELNYIMGLLWLYPKVTLLCYCAPKQCHCEVIRGYIYLKLKEKV